jgi:hypothetical protein
MASEASAGLPATAMGRHTAAGRGDQDAPWNAGGTGQADWGDPAWRAGRGDSAWRRAWTIASHPLTAICAVQAALSLTLVWSNTAFTDEADYLRLGHVIIASWLHGSSWPAAYGERVLSGSPVIYPPLGALADSVGGLAGARILSLAFLLGATILLYHVSARLLGRTEAIIAACLWALSEPVLRLAFATYDAMSVFGVALAAWLAVQAVQAGSRRRAGALVTASGAALALGTATAYSAIVVAPVLIAFAFGVWLRGLLAWGALYRAVWLAAAWLAFFSLLLTASRSWAGLVFSVLDRRLNDYQSAGTVLAGVALYSGLIIVAALLGAAIATRTQERRRAWLLVLLGAAALVVPAAQLYERTAWALDKHLTYGIWFAAIAGGFGCRTAAVRLCAARAGRRTARISTAVAVAGVAAAILAGTADWRLAALTYQSWPDATSFVASIRPLAARTGGLIFASAQKRVAQYYTPQGEQWWRWTVTDLPLDPAGTPRADWGSYYLARLRDSGYGLVALFYASPAALAPPGGGSSRAPGAAIRSELLSLPSLKLSEPGVPALTRVLARDAAYRLVAVGPYNSGTRPGIFAIWQQVAAPSG